VNIRKWAKPTIRMEMATQVKKF